MGRFDDDFIEARRAALQLFINKIALHPVLSTSTLVVTFLTATQGMPGGSTGVIGGIGGVVSATIGSLGGSVGELLDSSGDLLSDSLGALLTGTHVLYCTQRPVVGSRDVSCRHSSLLSLLCVVSRRIEIVLRRRRRRPVRRPLLTAVVRPPPHCTYENHSVENCRRSCYSDNSRPFASWTLVI